MLYDALVYSLLTGISICIYTVGEWVWYENPLLYGFGLTTILLFAWYAYENRPAFLGMLSLINILCILLDQYFDNRIGSGVLLLVGSTLYVLFSLFSFTTMDGSCTEEFKEKSWKDLRMDLSVVNIIVFGIFLLTDMDIVGYVVVQVIHAIYIVAISMPRIPISLPLRNTRFTGNEEQQSLFGINADENI